MPTIFPKHWSLTVCKTPLERVHKLLSKLDSIRVSKDRGSLVSKEADDLFYKFIEQVEVIFKNLPKHLKWLSFLFDDMALLTVIPLKVQKASVKHNLNNHLLATPAPNEFSARGIQAFAKDIEKTNLKNKERIDTAQCEFSTQIKISVMTRLGISLIRIAYRLNIHCETISKYAGKNQI